MKKLVFVSYNNGSQSLKKLKNLLQFKLLKKTGSLYKMRNNHVTINWGRSIPHEAMEKSSLNTYESIANSSCKLKFFETMSQSNLTPRYAKSHADALDLLKQCKTIVCRTVLNGHSGAGIVIASSPEEIVDAPLYVEYIPKKEEYRVHVFKGQVIHSSRKARKKDVPDEEVNWQVRNHKNGFIFQHENFELPEECVVKAKEAVELCGLDFGAVDIIWNDKQQKAYVLEINTAPGLEGKTLEAYANAFKECLNG